MLSTLWIGESIYLLWNCSAVQQTFKRRGNNYSFPDNIHYFFDQVTTIMSRDYRPTMEDWLKFRVRTTGSMEYYYDANDHTFVLYDLGGRRNERKKWMHHFRDVAAVIFCAALSDYHAVLFEDEKSNAMHESIQLFGNICDSKWFTNSEMILLLTKDDLFKVLIRAEISLSECFSPEKGWKKTPWPREYDYHPIIDDELKDQQHFSECHKVATNFIHDALMQVNKDPHRVIFCHVVDCVDEGNVQRVFWDIQNVVIRSSLRKRGLMM